MSDGPIYYGEDPPPDDRLGRIAEAGRQAIEAHPETTQDTRVMLSIYDGTGAALYFHGYGDMSEDAKVATIVRDLIRHAEIVLAHQHGHPVSIVPIDLPGGPN